jgi:hypothetical protein
MPCRSNEREREQGTDGATRRWSATVERLCAAWCVHGGAGSIASATSAVFGSRSPDLPHSLCSALTIGVQATPLAARLMLRPMLSAWRRALRHRQKVQASGLQVAANTRYRRCAAALRVWRASPTPRSPLPLYLIASSGLALAGRRTEYTLCLRADRMHRRRLGEQALRRWHEALVMRRQVHAAVTTHRMQSLRRVCQWRGCQQERLLRGEAIGYADMESAVQRACRRARRDSASVRAPALHNPSAYCAHGLASVRLPTLMSLTPMSNDDVGCWQAAWLSTACAPARGDCSATGIPLLAAAV